MTIQRLSQPAILLLDAVTGLLARLRCENELTMTQRKESKALARDSEYDGLQVGISDLLDAARRTVARKVNGILTATYWEIGRRIIEHEQGGRQRAEYGEQIVDQLAADLTRKHGRGFSRSNVFQMRGFFQAWEIFQTQSEKLEAHAKFDSAKIVQLDYENIAFYADIVGTGAGLLSGGYALKVIAKEAGLRIALTKGAIAVGAGVALSAGAQKIESATGLSPNYRRSALLAADVVQLIILRRKLRAIPPKKTPADIPDTPNAKPVKREIPTASAEAKAAARLRRREKLAAQAKKDGEPDSASDALEKSARSIPLGFKTAEEFAKFGSDLKSGLSKAGYPDAKPIFQGSSVTGQSYSPPHEPFDVGRTSDFDIAIASPTLMKLAKALGIKLRSGGTRSGPLE